MAKCTKPPSPTRRIPSLMVAFLLAASFLLTMGSSAVSAQGMLEVGDGKEYATIQAAVNAASSGDRILVYSGTYNEAVVINKSLTLRGEDRGTTEIKFGYGAYPSKPSLTISADEVTVSGFTIRSGPRIEPSWTIAVGGNSALLTNLHVIKEPLQWRNMNPKRGAAVLVSPIVDGFAFTNSTVNSAWNGIYTRGRGGNITVQNVDFTYPGEYAIFLKTMTGATIEGNIFTCTADQYGVIVTRGSDNIEIVNNQFVGSGSQADSHIGIPLQLWAPFIMGDVTIRGNYISGFNIGLLVQDVVTSGIFLNYNNIKGNTIGINSVGTSTVNAENNWWGTTDKNEIAGMVSGNVDFSPWLDAPYSEGNGGGGDPNFGYEEIGALDEYGENLMGGSWFTCPESGTADSISVYSGYALGVEKFKCAIYKKSNGSLVGETEEITGYEYESGWWTLNFTEPKPVLSNTDYWLLFWQSDWSPEIHYDSSEAGKGHNTTGYAYGSWPDPITITETARIYSIYCTYTAEAAAPGKPVLVSPENQHSTSDNTPTFIWTGGSDADNHRIEVDDDPDFSSAIDNVVVDITDNSWTKPSPGYAVDNYWWRVWAVNAQGETCSENTWTFEITAITQPPSKPDLIKPIENQPYFEWSCEGADNYRLLVDNDFDFSTLVENRILIENYYQIPVENSLENGVYWWKVIAINPIGETSSDVWTFSVGGVEAEPPIDLAAAAMFIFPIVLMIVSLAFDNPVFAFFAGVVFIISGLYFVDTIWLTMIFVGVGVYLLITAFMSEED